MPLHFPLEYITLFSFVNVTYVVCYHYPSFVRSQLFTNNNPSQAHVNKFLGMYNTHASYSIYVYEIYIDIDVNLPLLSSTPTKKKPKNAIANIY